jgi:hypothetical protein
MDTGQYPEGSLKLSFCHSASYASSNLHSGILCTESPSISFASQNFKAMTITLTANNSAQQD